MLGAPLRPCPCPRRLPQRKAMTIALGVIASDGIVVAADTQVTIPGYWKSNQGKIGFVGHASRTGPTGSCIVTGATDRLPYLKNLRVQVLRDFMAAKTITDPDLMESRFGNIVENFHERHVAPYRDHPEVTLLIAYQRGDSGRMWVTNRGTITEHGQYAAVGVGEPYASALLGRLWLPGYDLASAVAMAVYIANAVKDSVDGCGKFINLAYIQAARIGIVRQELVNELDALYAAYSGDCEPATLREVFGLQPRPNARPRTIAKIRRDVRRVVSRIRAEIPARLSHAAPRRSVLS